MEMETRKFRRCPLFALGGDSPSAPSAPRWPPRRGRGRGRTRNEETKGGKEGKFQRAARQEESNPLLTLTASQPAREQPLIGRAELGAEGEESSSDEDAGGEDWEGVGGECSQLPRLPARH